MNSISRIDHYLEKSGEIAPWEVAGDQSGPFDIAVVIPALAEKAHLFKTLKSLAANPPADLSRTLVLCVVNNGPSGMVSSAAVENNRETLARLNELIRRDDRGTDSGGDLAVIRQSRLRLAFIDASSTGFELPHRRGVGLARKIGLDHALKLIGRHAGDDGILVCLDADTVVEENYLSAVREAFSGGGLAGGVIAYAHRLPTDEAERAAIIAYEIFLRYYVLGLRYARSPYAFHTIGSTIACRAGAYAAIGGMVKREAGEDFYFLQKLAKYGDVCEIDTTTVYPSARPSWRVPFGTGRKVADMLAEKSGEIPLYNPASFHLLKQFLAAMEEAAKGRWPADAVMVECNRISPALGRFLMQRKFDRIWPRIVKNNPHEKRLRRQFHNWFDAFNTLKLLHYLRDNGGGTCPMAQGVAGLLSMTGRTGKLAGAVTGGPETLKLLNYLREMPIF